MRSCPQCFHGVKCGAMNATYALNDGYGYSGFFTKIFQAHTTPWKVFQKKKKKSNAKVQPIVEVAPAPAAPLTLFQKLERVRKKLEKAAAAGITDPLLQAKYDNLWAQYQAKQAAKLAKIRGAGEVSVLPSGYTVPATALPTSSGGGGGFMPGYPEQGYPGQYPGYPGQYPLTYDQQRAVTDIALAAAMPPSSIPVINPESGGAMITGTAEPVELPEEVSPMPAVPSEFQMQLGREEAAFDEEEAAFEALAAMGALPMRRTEAFEPLDSFAAFSAEPAPSKSFFDVVSGLAKTGAETYATVRGAKKPAGPTYITQAAPGLPTRAAAPRKGLSTATWIMIGAGVLVLVVGGGMLMKRRGRR